MKNVELQFYDAYKNGDDLYFSSLEFNGLFRYNIKARKSELLGSFPKEKMLSKTLHRRIVFFDDSIYFVPYKGKGIGEYNLKTKDINCYVFKEDEVLSFSNCYLFNDRLILIPTNNIFPFMEFDLRNKRFISRVDINKNITDKLGSDKGVGFDVYSSALIGQNEILLSVWGRNIVVEYNVISGNVQSFEFDDDLCIRNICFDNGKIYATELGLYGFVEISLHDRHFNRYLLPIKGVKELPYSFLIKKDDSVLLVPGMEDCIWEYDFSKSEWHNLGENYPKNFERINGTSMFVGYHVNDKMITFYPRGGNGILFMGDNIGLQSVACGNDDYAGIMKKCEEERFDVNNDIYFETENRTLRHFVEHIQSYN